MIVGVGVVRLRAARLHARTRFSHLHPRSWHMLWCVPNDVCLCASRASAAGAVHQSGSLRVPVRVCVE